MHLFKFYVIQEPLKGLKTKRYGKTSMLLYLFIFMFGKTKSASCRKVTKLHREAKGR